MSTISRRKLLVLAGAGTAGAAAVAAIPVANFLTTRTGNTITFKAVAGLPAGGKVPAYCTWVIEGHLDLSAKAGSVTTTMYAGPPELHSTTVWTGLSRIVRITDVRDTASALQISGEVSDRAHLRPGESATFAMRLDRAQGRGNAQFFGHDVELRLAA